MAFVAFKHTDTGAIAYYPEHYADDPTLSRFIEFYTPELEEAPEEETAEEEELEELDADTDKETK